MLKINKIVSEYYMWTPSTWIKELTYQAIFNYHRGQSERLMVMEEGMNQAKSINLNALEQIYVLDDYDEENFALVPLLNTSYPLDYTLKLRLEHGKDIIKVAFDISRYGKYISIESNTNRKLYFVLQSKN